MDCKIITGDNIHTAAQVALELKLGSQICFLEKDEIVDESGEPVLKLLPEHMLCMNGDQIAGNKGLIEKCAVFARTNPGQKADVIAHLNDTRMTLMCGDGTNDVRGLKKAHVGLAIVNMPAKPEQPTGPVNPMQELT
jgi:magnesium-transporting ATPase (P-type)